MPDFSDLSEEYELEWPAKLFKDEAMAIAALSTGDVEDYAVALLHEAFTESTPARNFQEEVVSNNFDQKWVSPSPVRDPRFLLRQLADHVDSFPKSGSGRPYWLQQQQLTPPRVEGKPKSSFRDDWLQLIETLTAAGYFSLAAGEACVDGLSEAEVDAEISRQIEKRIDIPDLWPLPGFVDEALGLTLVEVFHDLAARPRNRHFHEFSQCGWHHSYQAKKPGRAVYRWKVNDLLRRHSYGLQLAAEGEDTGRLIRKFDDPRSELLTAAIKSDHAPTKASAQHAIALFRKHDATREDKRSACAALALVLEDRRKLLKSSLLRKDEGMLFQIANEFDVRHRDGKQYDDLGEEFQDWVFWIYLSSLELTNRMVERGS